MYYNVGSDNVSIMQGKDTNDIIREIFDSFLYNYQKELKIIKGSDFVFQSVDLLDYKLHRVRLKRGGSYVKSPKWLLNKLATINAKNENDDECFRWSIISALNYNYIMKKSLKTYLEKLNMKIKIFHRIKKRDWENYEQNNKSTAINILFSSNDSEEITLLYETEYNLERENKVLLLMTNDDNEKYYFAVKSKLELYSSEWLRSKKESITSENNCFQNALNDSLNYKTIKANPERTSKLKKL